MGKHLDAALARLDKQFGEGVTFDLGARKIVATPVIPTGILSLDYALGVGGLPCGRVVEIFGPESGGKTTIALGVMVEAQKAGGKVAFVDAEHALDPKWATALGLKLKGITVCQPDYGEQALEVAEQIIRSGEVDVLVIDSVSALVPKAELEGEMGQAQMGLQARMMSQALRKLTGAVAKSHTILIFINQLRDKIGVMFGSPETTTGGKALKFYASIRLDVRRVQAIKDGDRVIGARTRVKVVKNKVSAPFREAEFDLLYGQGADRIADLRDLGARLGVIERSGSWYSFAGERLWNGKDSAKAGLLADPERRAQIETAVRTALLRPETAEKETPEEEEL